jgi:peptidoglycan hydrolase-like protein with peptidoglycan-binding domain
LKIISNIISFVLLIYQIINMKKALIASLAASALAIGSFAMTAGSANAATGYTFTGYLSVGSTGSEVVALQSWLVSEGFLTMPAGVSMGYFGSLTKAAVVAYQASVGLPDTGYVGPLTVGKLNAGTTGSMTTGTTFACPTGWTCTAPAVTTGTTVTTTTGSTQTGIETPGVQGIIAVTQGPVSTSVANAGQSNVPILDVRVQAQYSDVSVQSLQLDLGSSTSIYNFVYSSISVVDPSTGNVLTTVPLNPTTVVQNGSNYIVGLAGFSFIVPHGTYKDLVIEANLYNQINTQYANSTPWVVSVDQLGLRAVDGAGVNLYGPSGSSISQTMIIGQSLVTSATANVSLDGSSPLVGSVGVTNTTQGQYLGLPVAVFDVNANGDTLHLHSVTVGIQNAGSGTVSAAYLYQGSTPISSASVVGGQAIFQNISDGTPGASIPVNTTVPFTVKVDVSGLLTGVSPAIVTATTSASALSIYTSIDSNASVSGGAIGNAQTVFGQGPVFALSNASPVTTKTNISAGGSTGTTTFQYSTTFNVVATAIGENVVLGLPSALPAASFNANGTSTAVIYANGVSSTTASVGSVIVSYSQPTNTTINNNFFTLAQNQSVTIPVTYSFTVNNPGANTYAVQLNGIVWYTSSNGTTGSGEATSTFMSGQTQWRSTSI